MSMHPLAESLWGVLEESELLRPRTQQVAVGPSELGNPCDLHLAKRLHGWTRPEAAWLPIVGTAVHAAIDQAIVELTTVDEWQSGWRVDVDRELGIGGTFDAWHAPTAAVVDFKIVGQGVLDEARRFGPTQAYRIQAHAYARGLELQGVPVERVAIMYLPRNAPTFEAAYVWDDIYRPELVAAALSRALRLAALAHPQLEWLSGHVDCWHCKADRAQLAAANIGTAEDAMRGAGTR